MLPEDSARRGNGPGRSTRARVTLYSVDLRDSSADTIATMEGGQSVLAESGLILHLPFEALPYWDAGPGGLVFGHSSEGLLHTYLPGRGRSPLHLLSLPRNPVSRGARREWMAQDLDRAPEGEERTVTAHHRRLTFPDSFPVYQSLHVDAAGRVWVLRYEPPTSREDFGWQVLGPSGEAVAEVVVPYEVGGSHMRTRELGQRPALMHVGEFSVLIWSKDELGVQRIRRHRILKGR